MSDEAPGEWCLQTRSGSGERPTEHWVADVDAYLKTLSGPVQVRFTHGCSEYIGRFRDLDSTEASTITGVRYTEFGWRTVPRGAPA
jgi:hypothetical protein